MPHVPQRKHPALTKLRRLTATFPEGAEVEAWGHPTFRAGKKMFAIFGEHEGRPAICVKQTHAAQAALLEDPRFYHPPYVGGAGWIGIFIDATDWPVVAELVETGYRLVALKRMLRALDESRG